MTHVKGVLAIIAVCWMILVLPTPIRMLRQDVETKFKGRRIRDAIVFYVSMVFAGLFPIAIWCHFYL